MDLIEGFKFPEQTTIIYPDDSVLARVEETLGMTIKEIKQHPFYRDLMRDFTYEYGDMLWGRSTYFKTEWGLGYYINFEENVISSDNLKRPIKIVSNKTERNNRFVSIKGLFISPETLNGFVKTPKQDVKSWQSLPYDVFRMMVLNNQISGRDLISLCVSNPDINSKCNNRNSEIFRELLDKEYGIKLEKDEKSIQEIRDLYHKMTRTQVWTFGEGDKGQLGHGYNQNLWKPKEIEGFSGIKSISCGGSHTAFIDNKGQVWTFGLGIDGQLGHNDLEKQNRPKMIEGIPKMIHVSCGLSHTAMIDRKGQVWTFGEGTWGRLGHGDEKHQNRPKMIEGISGIVQVSCGFSHTAMINQKGQVWTCGDGRWGKLGHGDEENRIKPEMIEGISDIVQVSCGFSHTAMIDRKGQVWTCGDGKNGRLGHGDEEDHVKPKMITFIIRIPKIVQISCGYKHTVMLDSEGFVWTCGDGKCGKLGHGDEEDRFKPEMIQGFSPFKNISCESTLTTLIDMHGVIWFCGKFKYLPSRDNSNKLDTIKGFRDAETISLGTYHIAIIK